MIAIFDIDGVLADKTPIQKLNCQDPMQRAEFERAVPTLAPRPQMVELIKILAVAKVSIALFTSRSTNIKEETKKWLEEQDICYDALFMRAQGDNRSCTEVKKEYFAKFLLSFKDEKILVFEDNPVTAMMFKKKSSQLAIVCEVF